MCGIAGSYNDGSFDVEAAVRSLIHRGPDAQGVESHGPAVHGHARLSIIDPSPLSNQPFRYRDGMLSFNGEIWNFRELRDELRLLGHSFATNGDTEVLAAAMSEWGAGALERIDGMFAFAWTDPTTRILCRDRFGKVPIYVGRADAGFYWASERKGLAGRPARPLPAGAFLDLRTGAVTQWYCLEDNAAGLSQPDIAALLRDSVGKRMVSDAPLCCLISGGVDSSFILTLAKEMNPGIVAFTAYLEGGPTDELDHARRLCRDLGVELREVAVSRPSHADLTEAVRVIEIPMKAQVEIASMCLPLAREISRGGFKVLLSGEGADELFGGYGSMCIKGSAADDSAWRGIRVGQVKKMSRGNFVRCNKAFMSAGVECRLPFLDRGLVEAVLSMSKQDCPPGKAALKRAAEASGVPSRITRRVKQTFQGGAGMDRAAAVAVAKPASFYRSEAVRLYGRSAVERGA